MSTRVLIIDPNIPFMVSIKQALEGTGEYEVSVSANGLAAQDALSQTEHDIAIVDFNVPDMDTLELIAQLRRIQPDLPVILSYTTEAQEERVPYLGAQGALPRPYTARDLIGYVTARLRPAAPAPADEPADFYPITEAEAETDAPTPFYEIAGPADADEAAWSLDEIALFDAAPPDQAETGEADDDYEDAEAEDGDDAPGYEEPHVEFRARAQTAILSDQEEDPSETAQLFEWQDADQTSRLPKTDTLDGLMDQHGWVPAESAPPFLNEFMPEPEPDDTPTVPPQDLDGVRQFLATDQQGHDPTEFGEVLDALAKSPPDEGDPSPDDRAFHDLLDSMRVPSESHRRSTLEDLLSSLAADTPEVSDDDANDADDDSPPANTLDYVLDAIRRGRSPHPAPDDDAEPPPDADDATIGEVISGLFDPSFEGVLAALAGQDVDEESYIEPTYSSETPDQTSLAPDEADQFALNELADGDDLPAWMDEPADEPPDAVDLAGEEPPVRADDSSHYPATAALNAVRDDEDASGFSLNDLLSQIERQLPPPHERRPRLRPLPSWEADATDAEAEHLRELFPQEEDWEPASLEDLFAAPPDVVGAHEGDTLLEDIEGIPIRPADTQPAHTISTPEDALAPEWNYPAEELDEGEEMPADFDQLLDTGDEQEPEARDAIALELDLDDDLIDAVQRAGAEVPPEDEAFFETPPDEEFPAMIAEAFYEGVRHTAYDASFGEHEGAVEDTHEDADAAAFEEASEEPVEKPIEEAAEPPAARTEDEHEPTFEYEADEDEPAYSSVLRDQPFPAPDVDHLIELPVETAARLFGDAGEPEDEPPEEMAEDEAARLAEVALQLTQFSLESSAQASLLTYAGEMVAQAGDLPRAALDRLERALESAWATSPPDHDALIRFVTLPDAGEFLLYSLAVADGMLLSMVFNTNTPVHLIRRQALRLSESLELVPEESADRRDPAPHDTLISHPTALRPPEGLRQARAAAREAKHVPSPHPPRPDVPYTGYTLLWMPHDPRLELAGDFAQALHNWITDIGMHHAWEIDGLAVEADYVAIALRVPQKSLPDAVLKTLFAETTRRTQEHFPALVDAAGRLWASGYYVVTPLRDLTEREISRFLTYQRQSQAS